MKQRHKLSEVLLGHRQWHRDIDLGFKISEERRGPSEFLPADTACLLTKFSALLKSLQLQRRWHNISAVVESTPWVKNQSTAVPSADHGHSIPSQEISMSRTMNSILVFNSGAIAL
jgi:hypothetical protein